MRQLPGPVPLPGVLGRHTPDIALLTRPLNPQEDVMVARKAADAPDRVARLVAVRDALEQAIAECEAKRDLAALSREYRAVLAELEDLAPKEKHQRGVDEIGRRRAARRAAAQDQGHTEGAGG